ncbi:MAG: DUF4864 domain-containing protein [Paracoccaceae bacterium]
MMRNWIVGVVLALGMPMASFGQGNEIKGVISNQIEAFRSDDFSTAFTFASPAIQLMFKTPDNFGRMVSQGFPMVWRPSDVEYLGLHQEPGALVQRIQVTDAEGVSHVLDYMMVETADGWKINGVELVKNDDLSV